MQQTHQKCIVVFRCGRGGKALCSFCGGGPTCGMRGAVAVTVDCGGFKTWAAVEGLFGGCVGIGEGGGGSIAG